MTKLLLKQTYSASTNLIQDRGWLFQGSSAGSLASPSGGWYLLRSYRVPSQEGLHVLHSFALSLPLPSTCPHRDTLLFSASSERLRHGFRRTREFCRCNEPRQGGVSTLFLPLSVLEGPWSSCFHLLYCEQRAGPLRLV